MHDDLQCAGRDLPNHLFLTTRAADWFDNDHTGTDSRFQSDGEHVVRHELHDDATHVSDDLRQNIAVAVIGRHQIAAIRPEKTACLGGA